MFLQLSETAKNKKRLSSSRGIEILLPFSAGTLNTAYVYNFIADEWRQVASMIQARDNAACGIIRSIPEGANAPVTEVVVAGGAIEGVLLAAQMTFLLLYSICMCRDGKSPPLRRRCFYESFPIPYG